MSACPICKEPMARFGKTKPSGGRWVHLGPCAVEESKRVRALAREAKSAGDWLPLEIPTSVHEALRAPRLPHIVRREGKRYNPVMIFRLIARNDEEGFRAVLRMVERMMERQTVDEREQRKTKHLNYVGFNQPDAYVAASLLDEARSGGYSTFLHLRMAQLLMKYFETQLPSIMDAGAAKTGILAITNSDTMTAIEAWHQAYEDGRFAVTARGVLLHPTTDENGKPDFISLKTGRYYSWIDDDAGWRLGPPDPKAEGTRIRRYWRA